VHNSGSDSVNSIFEGKHLYRIGFCLTENITLYILGIGKLPKHQLFYNKFLNRMKKEEIIKKIKDTENPKIKFAVADIDGILRGKYIHKNKFLEFLEKSIGFCDVILGWDSGDVCYENSKVTGWHTGYPDAQVKIDGDTFREIPWENSTPFFIADFSGTGENYESVCSRSLLKNTLANCNKLGFRPYFALETEWFNFQGTPNELQLNDPKKLQPISPGMFGYSLLRTSLRSNYVEDLFNSLNRFNVPLEGLHTETGPGVYEAAIVFDEILEAADKAILFKNSVKEIAYRHNIVATFMAKWNCKLPGCGGHIHQSLWDLEGKTNLFFGKKNGLSKELEYYIAGQLICLPEILPMFAPTVNSYKRLGHGDWAPATASWGVDNRTAAIRYIPGNNKSARIEHRVPGADINPYLAMAASLASGLYGIKNKIKLKTPEITGNAYQSEKTEKLPRTLIEATQKMKDSAIAKELFGEAFVDHFVRTREWEWQQFTNEVTNWELQRYFEII
jgi:glutamine synthetase